jgi:hypothetical protein
MYNHLKYLFALLFFAGVVFSLLNELPLRENEIIDSLSELCKNQKKESQDNAKVTGDDESIATTFHGQTTPPFSNLVNSVHKYYFKQSLYQIHFRHSITLPPKL